MKLGFRLGIITSILVLLIPVAVAAQTPGQGLEISPPLLEVSAKPGERLNLSIKLRNVTRETLVTKASVDDFISQGEGGEPKLLIGNDAEPSPYSLKAWVQPIADLNLKTQEIKTASVVLQVPANASPGGHYGVVRFSAIPPELEGTGVSLSASIGTLLLVNVAGNVVTKATVSDFYVSQNNVKKSFFEQGPITFVERIRNTGSVHVKPIGTIRVANMLGREVTVLSVNEKGGNILPDSTRRFEQQLSDKRLFGRYQAEMNVQYSGQNLSRTISFWVIPYKFLAILLGGFIILGMLLRHGIKRYNRYIIEKSEKIKK